MGMYEIFIIFHIPGIKEMEQDGGDKNENGLLDERNQAQKGTP